MRSFDIDSFFTGPMMEKTREKKTRKREKEKKRKREKRGEAIKAETNFNSNINFFLVISVAASSLVDVLELAAFFVVILEGRKSIPSIHHVLKPTIPRPYSHYIAVHFYIIHFHI